MSTSNQQADQAKSHPKLITQADYIAADIMNRDSIEYEIHDLEGLNAPDENATSSFIQMHQKTISILQQALGHSSPVVSLNLRCLAEGTFQTKSEIDDSNTIQFSGNPDYEPIEDPDVDVEASKAAKLRLVKFMEDEAMILGNKDMENFLIWASGLVDGMSDCFEITQLTIQKQLSALGGIKAYEVGEWRKDSNWQEPRELDWYCV